MAEVERKAQIKPSQLVRAREAIGLSKAEAARRLNIEELTLSAWEEGRAFPDAEELYEITVAYRRPLAFFFEETLEERMPLDLRVGKGIIPGYISGKIKEGILLPIKAGLEIRE